MWSACHIKAGRKFRGYLYVNFSGSLKTVEQIKNISILLNPIIPNATNKILSMINLSDQNISIDKINDEQILNNKKELGNLEILFTKIEDDN